MHTPENHFYSLTHEFRTSLSLILGPTEQILKQEELDENYTRKQVRLIRQNSRKFLLLVNQVMDAYKLGHKKMSLEKYRGDVTDFIAAIVGRFREMTRQKHIRLNFDSQLPVADYLFDRGKLDKVLFNLLSNAVKFTPDGGKIQVTVSPHQNSEGRQGITLTVEDTGPGIDPEVLPHIFDGLYPLAFSTNKYEGTGIGLALTRGLVEFMEGKIEVESEVGKGTYIRIFLPVQPVASNISETEEERPPPHQPLRESEDTMETAPHIDRQSDRPVVQVITGHADLRAFVCAELSLMYQVLTEQDGAEGIVQTLKYVPDLIICDAMIPEVDGFQVCDTLKSHPKTNHIPILLLTDPDELKDHLKGLKKGADACLNKPFSIEELTLWTQQLIANRKLLTEKYKGKYEKTDDADLWPAANRDTSQQLISQLHAFIEKELDNHELDVEALAREMGMSHSQLYRKVKAITNLSLTGFVREYRLRRAMEFLKEGQHNVTEVAYRTGFSNRRYFHKVFVKKYGQAPSAIRTGIRKIGRTY
ncbi:helix-turn-helix domain-containing protein [Fulvivirga sp. M361]|uniref:hybrid sensor histidine kinase/response regulator transcription factor n=1 Tax=Fulvivirga sp. M361 TaxID=2594266 RepID=UPI001179B873|nr:ATP-binding protein [Fulvivirga sp. M361]TRX47248.1 helix-turn-helix domain-containing protein [Fulvivirga sp. M361]